jgi:predicted RNase H-like nuclease (RuvC/YqgF family)
MENWVNSLFTVIGSGAIGAIVTAIATKRKSDAEAQHTNVQALLEVDSRLNERISKLEERVAVLEAENIELKEENIMLKSQLKQLSETEIENVEK